MWLRGNALEDYDLDLGELLDANAFCGNVDVRLCVVSVTLCRGEHGGLCDERGPAIDAACRRRDPSRILFCDATNVVVMFLSLVAHDSLFQWAVVDPCLSIFRFRL